MRRTRFPLSPHIHQNRKHSQNPSPMLHRFTQEGEEEDSDAAGDESWGPGELNSDEDGSESDSDEEYKSDDSSGNF